MTVLPNRVKRIHLPFKFLGIPQPKPAQLFDSPARLVLLSFLLMIVIGTVLLKIPQATTSGSISLVDALFTATSATCVTGLTVVDTGSTFTLFGQIVILILIQVGGLGIMTLSTFFVYLIVGRLTITERDVVQDTFSQYPMADLLRLLKSVFLVTITIEIFGAALLALRFMKSFPLPQAIYSGLFHSIAAFCNAGFSLYANNLENYREDILINVVIAGLIILGGLGFYVIFDLYRNRLNLTRRFLKKLRLHTRVVLYVSTLLIILGSVFIFGLEYSNCLKGMSLKGKLLAAIFQSITPRTAGFNTVPIGALSNATLFLIILLMFIGASPGSTGGGIKTSTVACVMASVFARFRLQEDANIFYRRIPGPIVSRAISVVFFSSFVIVIFTMLILISESYALPHSNSSRSYLEYLFEVVSAFGTVGLSTGVTAQLTDVGKILITMVMFIGRVGPLTIALAVKGEETVSRYKYVQEVVLVG